MTSARAESPIAPANPRERALTRNALIDGLTPLFAALFSRGHVADDSLIAQQKAPAIFLPSIVEMLVAARALLSITALKGQWRRIAS